jgi:pullulanase/glycogen debranching enzyme
MLPEGAHPTPGSAIAEQVLLFQRCGAEGPSAEEAIEALRRRQIKNFLALNILAVGTPMLLMGDE